jgi:hypothetical protein
MSGMLGPAQLHRVDGEGDCFMLDELRPKAFQDLPGHHVPSP